MSTSSKVLCVGLNKTGLTSLRAALVELGFDVAKPDMVLGRGVLTNPAAAESEVRRRADRHEAFADLPWMFCYKWFSSWYPGTKYILTTRGDEDWLKSYRNYMEKKADPSRVRPLMFGDLSDAAMIAGKHRLERAALDYLSSRSEDVLCIDLVYGQGWAPLCAFLGKPVPATPFPHLNKAPQ